MNTEIAVIDPVTPDPRLVARAAGLLRSGRLVCFPTETVYGLGANALDPEAIKRIFWAKGRPATNPLIVHVHDPSLATNVAAYWPAVAMRLADSYWPGPLTIVVPKNPVVPDEVTAGGPTVGIRCPDHPVAQALLRAAGIPVAAPSANQSTELSPTRAEHVVKSLGGRIDMVLDAGPCPGGIESTVLDVTGPVVRVLRPGPVTVPMLEAIVGPVEAATRQEGVARSPGQMEKHYSPRTPMIVSDYSPEALGLASDMIESGKRVGLFLMELICGNEYDEGGPVSDGKMYVKYMPCEPEECAALLYDILHGFDQQNLDAIVVNLPPDTPEWAAIRDRLTRAAGRS